MRAGAWRCSAGEFWTRHVWQGFTATVYFDHGFCTSVEVWGDAPVSVDGPFRDINDAKRAVDLALVAMGWTLDEGGETEGER